MKRMRLRGVSVCAVAPEAGPSAAFDAAVPPGIEVLRDRRPPRSRTLVDHLVVAPSGIWVVDAEGSEGPLERRDAGGWFRTDARLYVGGRDRTRLVDGVAKQVAAVEDGLAGGPFEGAPVHGALCFVGAPAATRPGGAPSLLRVRGVLVSWPRELVATMAATTALDTTVRAELLQHLVGAFPPV